MVKTILVIAEKPFSKDATAKIEALVGANPEFKLVCVQGYKDKADVYTAVADVDALVVRSDKVDETLLEHAKNLKIVVRAGAGYDNVDLAGCTKRGIVVMNTPGQNSNAVAELAIGLAITTLRKGFSGKSGNELRGRKLGLQAFGAVAKCLARIAKGFEMEVFAYDPYIKAETFAEMGVTKVETLEELYKTCNVISIHTPLKPETRGCVNAALLGLLAKDALLINTARVEVIDEEALKAAMKEKPGMTFCADVKPKCADEMIAEFGNRCTFTAIKCGAQTEEANANCGTAAATQIMNFFEKGDVTFQVNKN